MQKTNSVGQGAVSLAMLDAPPSKRAKSHVLDKPTETRARTAAATEREEERSSGRTGLESCWALLWEPQSAMRRQPFQLVNGAVAAL
mmetsp:Transcript_21076/g.42380  ORF Transcript_21076/g.42380 Transcript_21076/m.42380 type:complete len:87 (-) Transcript_21076:284-544(-)